MRCSLPFLFSALVALSFGCNGGGGDGDATDPMVLLTSPADGATVGGEVPLAAEATDNQGVVRVAFLVDDIELASDDEAPYEATWAPTEEGTFTVTARATDAAGNVGQDVAVVNVVLDAPPVVSITDPVDGAWVNGNVTVLADVTDDVAVERVAFLVDGKEQAATKAEPYSALLFPGTSGKHSLGVMAWDSAGQTGEQTIAINMDTRAPVVDILSPASGAVFGIVEIQVNVSEASELSEMALEVGGEEVASFGLSEPYTLSWDSSSVPVGPVTLTVLATDLAGNQGIDQVDVIVDPPPEVEITAPVDGDTVSGTVAFSAIASDDDGVASVAFLVGGSLVGTVKAAPFSVPLDTCTLGAGTRLLEVVARDAYGGSGTDVVSVLVEQPLEALLASPTGGMVAPDQEVSVLVSDDLDAGDSVALTVDGGALATVTSSAGATSCAFGCTCSVMSTVWDTRSLAEGTHTLGFSASNASGEYTSGSVDVVVVYDQDADGFDDVAYGGTDCDDHEALAYPGGVEVCDGVDNDCSGAADEAWDLDGDGYPDPTLCPGFGDDCDDSDATINPGADEICDGIDNDCDGVVDASGATDSFEAGRMGARTTSVTVTSTVVGNVVSPSANTHLAALSLYMEPSGTVTYHPMVFESSTRTGTYALVESSTETATGGASYYGNSVLFDVPMLEGRYYFLALGIEGSATVWHQLDAALTEIAGIVPYGKLEVDGSATATTIDSDPVASDLFYMLVTTGGSPVEDEDFDGDGLTPFCGDCDDADADSYPGAEEIRDRADNDCDGEIDEGLVGPGDTWIGREYFGIDLDYLPFDGDFDYAQCYYDTVGSASDHLCDGCVWAYDVTYASDSDSSFDPYGYCRKIDTFFDGLVWTESFYPDYDYAGYPVDVLFLYYDHTWYFSALAGYDGDRFYFQATYRYDDTTYYPGYYMTELRAGYAYL
jgi:hypothetical protein